MEAVAAMFASTAAPAAATGVVTTATTVGIPASMIAGGGAAAGGSGLMGAFASLTAGDILSGGLTAFSALSNIASGNAAAASLETQAAFEDFSAKQEILKGRQEALEIAEAANDALEANIVRTYAAGLTGEGSPGAAQRAIQEKANFETGISRDTSTINAGARRTKAQQLRLDATGAKVGGVAAAAGDVANFVLRRTRRG
ncbi:MAG: hypothetical protein OXT06_19015 [Rhodospirillaceae bacterium]|nr:hypothetical protein [Rhodospirillaceae bacterium]